MGLFDKSSDQPAADSVNVKVAEAIAMMKEKVGGFGGPAMRPIMEAQAIGAALRPDERLVTMVAGKVNHKSGLVALTDQRIIFAESSITRHHMETFSLDEVDTVTVTGFSNKKLQISSHRRTAEVDHLKPVARAREFVDAYRQLTRDGGVKASASNRSSQNSDLAAQLNQLTELHRTGALTDDQFEAAKKRVLGE